MTVAVLSNGGGVGTGKAINGGFGLVLDGSDRVERILDSALEWDAMSGVSRRAWARNTNAIETIDLWNNEQADRGHITAPIVADLSLVEDIVARAIDGDEPKR
jgi:urocanate hydratase